MDTGRILWICGVLAEAGVLILLVRKHFFATLPVFSSYVTWSLFSDIAVYFLRLNFPKQNLWLYFLPEIIVDSIFQFAVLVELGWAVLLPIRPSLRKRTIAIIGFLIVVIGAIIWPIVDMLLPRNVADFNVWVHLQQTFAVLRIVIFLGLAALSQVLSIGWKDRELQIATGLGFYSLVSFAVSIIHSHLTYGTPQYMLLDQVAGAAYICSLVYFVVSFAQKEAPRREMTPQMQNLLLTLAGTAHTTRAAMAGSSPARE